MRTRIFRSDGFVKRQASIRQFRREENTLARQQLDEQLQRDSLSTDVLASPEVRQGMQEAWERSQADDPILRHEEGGYIVLSPDGKLQTLPWPQGERGLIEMPERDADGKYKGFYVVSIYHTHPNPPVDEEGRRWEQGPSEIDIETIRREKYLGDSFVISDAIIYRVKPDGREEEVGEREKTLA